MKIEKIDEGLYKVDTSEKAEKYKERLTAEKAKYALDAILTRSNFASEEFKLKWIPKLTKIIRDYDDSH